MPNYASILGAGIMSTYIYSIASVLVVSCISFAGVLTLSLKEGVLRKYIFILISLAVGALIGDAFIHLIPDAFERSENHTLISMSIIAGIFIFFVFEKLLHWHHHETDDESHPDIKPTGRMILVSDGVHNFIDGLIIGASYLASVEVGLATTLAIILHEIPQEIGDFGVLIHSGYSVARTLLLNFLSALFALFGTLIALVLGGGIEAITIYLIPFAAGGFIYIALSDLIPEMHKTKHGPQSAWQLISALIGIGSMLLLLLIG